PGSVNRMPTDAADSTDRRPTDDPAARRGADGEAAKARATAKFRGPILFRRDRKPGIRTADRNLLDTRGDADWVHSDPWRVLRIQAEFVEGFGALAEVPRAVTVFGSARTPVDHPEYEAGYAIGAALARAGLAVITGGGPGAMEAANRGASEEIGYSIGQIGRAHV